MGLRKPRKLPAIFAVNTESREFCLEQYVPFAGTYIHPTRDILFFSAEDENRFWLAAPSFYHITDHPLRKLRAVAIEVEYDKPNSDFSGHMHWIRGLGAPKELIICPTPSSRSTLDLLADHYLQMSGAVRIMNSAGNITELVQWPDGVDQESVQKIKPKLMRALQEEKDAQTNFQIPWVGEQLYFAYSDPFWL